jgi:predicted amidohydrolase
MTFSEAGFWRVRHCAQARCIENQIYAVHACAGGDAFGPYPGGWAGSSVLGPCDVPWSNPKGILAEVPANEEGVAMAELDLDALRRNRIDGAATTYHDRRRRAALYDRWPSHLLSSPTIT